MSCRKLSNWLCVLALTGTSGATLVVGSGCAEVMTYGKQSRAQGISFYESGQYTDAAGAFRNAVRQRPHDYPSHYYLGLTYEKMGMDSQALQSYGTALDVMRLTSEGREDTAFRDQVTDAYAKAVARHPQADQLIDNLVSRARRTDDPQAYLLLARTHAARGDAESALEAYDRGAAMAPNDASLARSHGMYLRTLQQHDRARAVLGRAYSLDPTDTQTADALRSMGVVPGPSLKPADELARPVMPNGPLPDLELRITGIGEAPAGGQ
ncbi:MAG: tetratricopeptide repeat protein [Phycisphaerae bacterium]